MMKFELSEEQQMLRDAVREFVNAEIKPIARQIDEEEEIPRSLIDKLAELGFLGAVFPEEYGGGGFNEVGYCLLQEEMGHGCLSTATFIGAHQSIGTNAIYLGGSEDLKKKYVPDLATGKKIGAFALTEVLAGSDSFNLRTKARKEGNEWILDGEKMWITNGNIADVVSVFARTEKGITGFVVETQWDGYTSGVPEKKMGIRGSATTAISLEGIRVPEENLIGSDGRGFIVAMKTLDAGRLGSEPPVWAARKNCWKCQQSIPNNGSNSMFRSRNSKRSSGCSLKWRRRSTTWNRSFIAPLPLTMKAHRSHGKQQW